MIGDGVMAFIITIYYGLWISNFYFALHKRKNKIVLFLTWILLYLLFASNSAVSGDAYKYKLDYEYGVFGTNWTEAGNVLLKWVCKTIGFSSYNQYLIVLFGLSSILLFLGIKRLGGNGHIIFAATMGFIFPAMAVAIRFFLAFSIFVFCLTFLMNGEHGKYIIGVLIATTFHRSAVFFLLFLLSETVSKSKINDKYRKTAGLIVCILAVGCTIYTLMVRKLPFISLITVTILKLFPNTKMKIAAYFGSFTRFGFLIMLLVYIANFVFSKYMMKLVNDGDISFEKNDVRLASFGYTINLLSATLLPLTIVNLVFFRLYAAQTFINCIVFGRIVRKLKANRGINALAISPSSLYYFFSIVAWIAPAVFQINSISINHMILDSIFV